MTCAMGQDEVDPRGVRGHRVRERVDLAARVARIARIRVPSVAEVSPCQVRVCRRRAAVGGRVEVTCRDNGATGFRGAVKELPALCLLNRQRLLDLQVGGHEAEGLAVERAVDRGPAAVEGERAGGRGVHLLSGVSPVLWMEGM